MGQVVRLEGQPYEIVGVMPREFDFAVAAELWMPMALIPLGLALMAAAMTAALARQVRANLGPPEGREERPLPDSRA